MTIQPPIELRGIEITVMFAGTFENSKGKLSTVFFSITPDMLKSGELPPFDDNVTHMFDRSILKFIPSSVGTMWRVRQDGNTFIFTDKECLGLFPGKQAVVRLEAADRERAQLRKVEAENKREAGKSYLEDAIATLHRAYAFRVGGSRAQFLAWLVSRIING